jgi:hypothetical protein
MNNIVARTSNITLQQIAGVLLATGGDFVFGMGALRGFHSLINVVQSTVSVLMSLNVTANEVRENISAENQVGPTLRERGFKLILKESTEVGLAAGYGAVGLLAMWIGLKLGGQSLQQTFVDYAGGTIQKDLLTLAFTTCIISTAGNTIMGIGTYNTMRAGLSTILTGFSVGYAMAIKSNEEKEVTGTDKKIGKTLYERSIRFIKNDLIEIPTSILITVVGVGILFIGSRAGGQSFQSSALEMLKKSLILKKA